MTISHNYFASAVKLQTVHSVRWS